MMCYMRFEEDNQFFDVSEVNTNNNISVSMGDNDNPNYANFMELPKEQILKLRDFLNKALSQLD